MENEQTTQKILNQLEQKNNNKNDIKNTNYQLLSVSKKFKYIIFSNDYYSYDFSKEEDVSKLIDKIYQLENFNKKIQGWATELPKNEDGNFMWREFLKIILNTPKLVDKIIQGDERGLECFISGPEDVELFREFLKNQELVEKIKPYKLLALAGLYFADNQKLLKEIFASPYFIIVFEKEIQDKTGKQNCANAIELFLINKKSGDVKGFFDNILNSITEASIKKFIEGQKSEKWGPQNLNADNDDESNTLKL